MEAEPEVLNDKLLTVMREYVGKLSMHSAAFAEMRWSFYIRMATFLSLGVVIIVLLNFFDGRYFRLGPEIFIPIFIGVILAGMLMAVQFMRSYTRLRSQLRSERFLCGRLVTRASEILEQSLLSSQDRFVFEISLYEAERALRDADESLDSALGLADQVTFKRPSSMG